MHLSVVRARNFRCLQDVTMTMGAGLNVLVGENNVGKTALLDAIRAALGSAASTGEPIRIIPEDRHRQADGMYLDQPIIVNLTFVDLSQDEQAQFIDLLNYNPVEPAQSTAQLNFRWVWNPKTKHYSAHRWGGAAEYSENSVPEDVLQSTPITLLGALRDATSALLPGRNSRLANLLDARATDTDREQVVAFGKKSNDDLEKNKLIQDTQDLISQTLSKASGKIFAQKTSIKTTTPEFEKIVQGLRLVISRLGIGEATDELRTNGLGFNNLFFIATVVLELNAKKNALLPLLLVEEPEAHLHPQLQTLLADFLSDPKDLHPAKVQTLITTHSPTIAAHVKPEQLRVLHRSKDGTLRCAAIGDSGLKEEQFGQLRRMLDVTRASLLFSRGVILVEGVTEALLLPIFARRLGLNLEENGISIVPVCGVEFLTIASLFGDTGLRIPLAIVTDGDPGMQDDEVDDSIADETKEGEPEVEEESDTPWQKRLPRRDSDHKLMVCARVKKLNIKYAKDGYVGVFPSDVTLEYSLADAADGNPLVMCDTWTSLFKKTPKTFNKKRLDACNGDKELRTLTVWRGICQATTTRTKAEFAQALATKLNRKDQTGEYVIPSEDFTVPEYLQKAFKHVLPQVASAN